MPAGATGEIAGLVGRDGGDLVDQLVAAGGMPTSFDSRAAWLGLLLTVISATPTFVELRNRDRKPRRAHATRAARAGAHGSGHVLRANQVAPHGSHAHASLPSREARARRRSIRSRWRRAQS